ncbi:hypothetical protein HDV00_005997 [Rhizophlyctis rosea]|nr:hypothetical protein HDV00_005997 [Rhizophlyctis rosea]
MTINLHTELLEIQEQLRQTTYQLNDLPPGDIVKFWKLQLHISNLNVRHLTIMQVWDPASGAGFSSALHAALSNREEVVKSLVWAENTSRAEHQKRLDAQEKKEKAKKHLDEQEKKENASGVTLA